MTRCSKSLDGASGPHVSSHPPPLAIAIRSVPAVITSAAARPLSGSVPSQEARMWPMRCTQTDEDETRTTISVEQEACELFDSQNESKVSVKQANSELGMGPA